ncbi:MAG: hypothetical protein IH949_12855 [Bacteroidetes bacterium]|nr:hypothetical protein [Bacteroidota bacterium]
MIKITSTNVTSNLNEENEVINFQQLPSIDIVEQVGYSSEGVTNRAFKKSRYDETILPFIKHIGTTLRGIFNCFAFSQGLAYN